MKNGLLGQNNGLLGRIESSGILNGYPFNKYHNGQKTRWEWNRNLVLAVLLWACFTGMITYALLCEVNYYECEQTCVSYDGQILVTDSGNHTLKTGESAHLDKTVESIESGDTLLMKISEISGEVLEIFIDGELIYQQSNNPWYLQVVLYLILLSILSFFGLFFYAVNAKNPRGDFARIQKEIVYRPQ